jgi:heme oxygenase
MPSAPTPFSPSGPLHSSLRAATHGEHMTVDRMISRFDLTRREDYGDFLNIHYGALQALRPDWRPEDAGDFGDMAHALRNDLEALGMTSAKQPAMARAAQTTGNRLGIAYVIRGSRLGSRIIRSRVSPEFAASYLDFIPAQSWTQFLRELAASPENEGCGPSRVIGGARYTFELFARLLTQAPA